MATSEPVRTRRRWRGIIVLVAALAGVALAARLGLWQLHRADQKLALQASLEARSHEPPLDAATLARTSDLAQGQQHRGVAVRGHWVTDRTVFLDNRQMDGKVGFFVVTPLALDATAATVLVERGWAPRNFAARDVLPPVATPEGDVTVVGTVAPTPARLFDFGGAASGPIRQNLDIDAFARETGLALLPLSIVQSDTGAAADGLVRHWPQPAADVQKHYGYAAQWFAIAAGIAILYVWHRFIRPGKP
ncbi:MAG: SURF1 family protein [Rhizobacter sp.]|nr:SURF1 family protein [Rhizobacter sp.]